MAKLSDLVNVDINRSTIKIQGVEIPVIFTFKSFPYVEEAYGKSYGKFEHEMHKMMENGQITLGKKEIKLMHSLIYAMVRSGGTDCTISEIENAIPLTDLPDIFQVAIDLFNNQNFQKTDMDKLKTEKKN
jgi:hypothetical protein